MGCAIACWHPMASSVTMQSASSSIRSKGGRTAISWDRSATACGASTQGLVCAQALTRGSVHCPCRASREGRTLLPSIATSCPRGNVQADRTQWLHPAGPRPAPPCHARESRVATPEMSNVCSRSRCAWPKSSIATLWSAPPAVAHTPITRMSSHVGALGALDAGIVHGLQAGYERGNRDSRHEAHSGRDRELRSPSIPRELPSK